MTTSAFDAATLASADRMSIGGVPRMSNGWMMASAGAVSRTPVPPRPLEPVTRRRAGVGTMGGVKERAVRSMAGRLFTRPLQTTKAWPRLGRTVARLAELGWGRGVKKRRE